MAKMSFNLKSRWVRVLGVLGLILLIAVVLSYYVSNDILRRYMENRINHNLKEYTVRIKGAYFHPIGFSLDLKNAPFSFISMYLS